jgi:hypothetical protein
MPRYLQRAQRQSDIKSHDPIQINPNRGESAPIDVDLSLKWKDQAKATAESASGPRRHALA